MPKIKLTPEQSRSLEKRIDDCGMTINQVFVELKSDKCATTIYKIIRGESAVEVDLLNKIIAVIKRVEQAKEKASEVICK